MNTKKAKRQRVRATVPGAWTDGDDLKIEKPGPSPLIVGELEHLTDEKRESLRETLYLQQLQGWVYEAVYGRDPFFQDLIRDVALSHLRLPDPFPAPLRAWLAYVIRKVDKLPREGKRGRTFDRAQYLTLMGDLMRFCQTVKANEPATAALKRAAGELHMSYERVRAMYYSDAFMIYRVKK